MTKLSPDKREASQNLREESQNYRQGKAEGMILQKLDDIQIDIQEFKVNNKEEHSKIIVQTTTTNGKVADISRWKERITGGLIILNLFVVPVMFWLLYERLTKGA